MSATSSTGHWYPIPLVIEGPAIQSPMCDGERCRRVARWVFVEGDSTNPSEMWACDDHHAASIQ